MASDECRGRLLRCSSFEHKRPVSGSLSRVGNFPLVFPEGPNETPAPAVRRGRSQSPVKKKAPLAIAEAAVRRETVGVCFDIDGVFKHGGRWEPKGAAALRLMHEANVPFIFMTNGGGGRTELQYVEEICERLEAAELEDSGAPGAPLMLEEERMLLSYSPWSSFTSHLKTEPVLIVGSPKEMVMNVARSYGYERAVHLEDYDAAHPLMDPFKKENERIDTTDECWNEGLKAILVFTDPANFCMAMQILTDVLLSSRPGEVEFERDHLVPIYFSNPDLLWKTQYPFGRFGQGAFRIALRAVYEARLHSLGASEEDVDLRMRNWIQYGKPTIKQYQCAQDRLIDIAESMGAGRIAEWYMVGDNPHSDMQGCVNMNDAPLDAEVAPGPWSGILVKTGVYTHGEDDPNHAAEVCEQVYDAVKWILTKDT